MLMKKAFNFSVVLAVLLALAACSGSDSSYSSKGTASGADVPADKQVQEDILVGELKVLADETIYPLLKEQQTVFEASYPNAKLAFSLKPEVLAVRSLLADEAGVAILSRELNEEEHAYFAKRSITPRVFPIWTDGIVLLGNTNSVDSSVNKAYLAKALRGEALGGKKLLFENVNSSNLRALKNFAGLEQVASANVEVLGKQEALLEAVAQDANKIAVMGYNVYLDLISSFPDKNNIRILSVQNTEGDEVDNKFYKPSQSSIAAGQYPLRRTFYVLNYQPNLGLGLGFSAFLTGDRGQRIVLKAGLVPAEMPGRDIIIRDEVPL